MTPDLGSSASNSETSAISSSKALDPSSPILDLAIIGGGPAALAAAVYAGRAGLKTQVFERAGIGGALAEISHLSNYPGFDGPGPELAEQMRAQAAASGVEITYGECRKLWRYADHFELILDDEPVLPREDVSAATNSTHGDASAQHLIQESLAQKVLARNVLVATGSVPKKLSFAPKPPVSYCALCDGDLAKGKRVAVIGGANSAVQESLYLANLVGDLTIITHSRLKADAYLLQRLAAAQKAGTQKTNAQKPHLAQADAQQLQQTEAGAQSAQSARDPKNNNTQSSCPITILEDTEPTPELLNTFDYVFVFIGKRPATDFLRPLADSLLSEPPLLTPDGYIITRLSSELSPAHLTATGLAASNPQNSIHSQATPHSTVIPGLYVAGDVRFGSLKQVVTAAADGAAAAIEIAHSAGLTTLE